jgi:hypothetical protein
VDTDEQSVSTTVNVARLALGVTARWTGLGWLQPGASASLAPHVLHASRPTESETHLGIDAMATLSLAFVGRRFEIAPHATVGVFAVPGDRGASLRVLGGLSLATRGRR